MVTSGREDETFVVVGPCGLMEVAKFRLNHLMTKFVDG